MQEQIRENTKESYALAILEMLQKDSAYFMYSEFEVAGVWYSNWKYTHPKAGVWGIKIPSPTTVVDWDAAWDGVDAILEIIKEREASRRACETLQKKLDSVLTEDERKMVVVMK